MIGTVIYASTQFLPTFGDYTPQDSNSDVSVLSRLGNIYLLLPVATYAMIFHQAISDLTEPVADKSQLAKIFALALILSFFAYAILATTVSWYFRDTTNVSSNLNWINFHGTFTDERTPLYARFISFFVVLFPAFDVASVFPLNAITLGNSLLGSYYGAEVHLLQPAALKSRKELFRLAAALPPLIAAYFVRDIGAVTDVAGVTGFAVCFIFPALLGYYSHKELKSLGLSTATRYSVPGLSEPFTYIITFTIGVGFTIYVLATIILSGAA
jgi:hypothetical protein